MKKKQCEDLLELTGDKCGFCKKGRFRIVCDIWFDGGKVYYLKCDNCGESYDG